MRKFLKQLVYCFVYILRSFTRYKEVGTVDKIA